MVTTRGPGPEAPRGPDRGGFLYAAKSRRSGGLSLGVNLFPAGKLCNFDCAYCEVAETGRPRAFDPELLRREFAAFAEEGPAGGRLEPLKDIAFAGNGEPTLSPFLGEALEIAFEARSRFPAVFGGLPVVLITNSTGFLAPAVAGLLDRAVAERGLRVWAKLDAGSEAWYRRIDRAGPPFAELVGALESFALRREILVQTMFCASSPAPGLGPEDPPEDEVEAWRGLLSAMILRGGRLSELQVYTQARPSPHGLTSPLPDAWLAAAAASTLPLLREAGFTGKLRVFGESGLLAAEGAAP